MKRVYKLIIIEESEVVPSKPPRVFAGRGGLLVRIGLAIASYFHWGH